MCSRGLGGSSREFLSCIHRIPFSDDLVHLMLVPISVGIGLVDEVS